MKETILININKYYSKISKGTMIIVDSSREIGVHIAQVISKMFAVAGIIVEDQLI